MLHMAADQDLHCLLTEISMENAVKIKTSTRDPKTRNELIQMTRMDKSTVQNWVKELLKCVHFVHNSHV